MKVILEEGCVKPVVKTIFKTICPKCGCVFEFEADDFETRVKDLSVTKTKTFTDGYMGSIVCPYCKKEFSVYVNMLDVRQEVVDEKTSTEKEQL